MGKKLELTSPCAPLRTFYGINWEVAEQLLKPTLRINFDPFWIESYFGRDATGKPFVYVGDGHNNVLIASLGADFTSASTGRHNGFVFQVADFPSFDYVDYLTTAGFSRAVGITSCRDFMDRGFLVISFDEPERHVVVLNPACPMDEDSTLGDSVTHGQVLTASHWPEHADPDEWLAKIAAVPQPAILADGGAVLSGPRAQCSRSVIH